MSFTTKSTVLVTLLVVFTICSANLATGRASLRPSAGKRSVDDGLPRTPGFYRLTSQDQECSPTTQVLLEQRLLQLQQHLQHVTQLMELCQNP
ncbi:unnamed protein product [Caenorhabditis angaria]|uniref:Uncharacterized protein n=1 Tax=Caenorhabditis angaria TaxID=860376 RepID=A0A9P1N2Z5_9PELO|nr:unnamed protein product [Caenorhabditis angaria]